jgi:hypothetical protein
VSANVDADPRLPGGRREVGTAPIRLAACVAAGLAAGIAVASAQAPVPVPPARAAIVPLPVPVVTVPPALPATAVVPPNVGRSGRCLPGFAPNSAGLCARHDDPPVACPPAGGPCELLPPDPLPYGPGAALRLNY